MNSQMFTKSHGDRRCFIGGSDARIVMGDDEPALLRLWREKRGEIEPEDLSSNLIVQLGTVTEDSIGGGTNTTPARLSPRCSGEWCTR
jgi:predicted phage-related endonuclease